jgi:hypothetical protein
LGSLHVPEKCRYRFNIVFFGAPRVTSLAGEGHQPPFGSPRSRVCSPVGYANTGSLCSPVGYANTSSLRSHRARAARALHPERSGFPTKKSHPDGYPARMPRKSRVRALILSRWHCGLIQTWLDPVAVSLCPHMLYVNPFLPKLLAWNLCNFVSLHKPPWWNMRASQPSPDHDPPL